MRNELTILNALKRTIVDGLEGADDSNVIIDFPDIDKMPKTFTIFLQPNWSDYENLSTSSDSSTFDVSVFLICKKDTRSNLTIKVYEKFNALYLLLRQNTTLNGEADFTQITDADFYPAVEGNQNVKAVEASVAIRYTKDF